MAFAVTCREHYNARDGAFAKDQKFYNLEFQKELRIPTEFKTQGIVLPTGRNHVDAFVDHIDVTNARVFANKQGTSLISQEDAEMLRKFWLGLIHRNNIESDINQFRQCAKYFALHGLGPMKTLWDADRWTDKPEQKDGESEDDYAERIDQWRDQTHESVPIVYMAVNPIHLWPDPTYAGRSYVIEHHQRLVYDMTEKWGRKWNVRGKKSTETVETFSFWGKHWRCEMVGNETVLPYGGVVRHKYNLIPYVLMESGLGNLDAESLPENRYVGILRYMYDMLVSESRNFSIRDIVLAKGAWGGGYLTGPGAKLVTELTQAFGEYPALPEGVEVHQWESQTVPEMFNYHLGDTSARIAEHAAPRSTRGLPEQGVRSAADRSRIEASASARFQYSVEAFKNGACKVLINCARIMKNVIPGDIRVWGGTPGDEFDMVIKKERMKEPFPCYIEFSPISEEDEYRRTDALIREMTSGLVTKQWARRQMPHVNANDMEKEELREKILASPSMWQVIDQAIASKVQMALTEVGGLPAPQPMGGAPMAQGPQATPQGRNLIPPSSPKPVPGSPEYMALQLKNQRSRSPMFPGQGAGGGGNRP